MKATAVLNCLLVLALATGAEAEAKKTSKIPDKHALELGLSLGGFFPSNRHEWYDPANTVAEPLHAGFTFHLRAGYFPVKWVGAELESGLFFSGQLEPSLRQPSGNRNASLWHLRGHAVGAYPIEDIGLTPFVVVGLGAMGIDSAPRVLGTDTDLLFHWGLGAKYYITNFLNIRADFRNLIGPRSFSLKGKTAHYEITAGVAYVFDFGKKKAPPPPPPPPPPADTDGDGVLDKDDQCPKLAGEPPKGCPVGDSDSDGITDHDDRCPSDPEDKDGFEDEDGCPDPDNDKDGIPDVKDKCPNEIETLNGVDDEDGCPEDVADDDKDGIANELDKCKDEPEDRDGFEDSDGCPDTDNDGDGVMDDRDACPDKPGVVENNGCPDVDTDSDGVPDRIDNCPNEAGSPENFGCKKKQLVKLSQEKIEILEKVFFATGKAKIKDRSFGLLDNIAEVLVAHPEIKKLRVEGHTDTVGSAEMNKKLSQRRAEAVVRYLEEKGVSPERLEPIGFGQEKPIAPNTTRRGRASNRRVEFNIVEGSGELPTK